MAAQGLSASVQHAVSIEMLAHRRHRKLRQDDGVLAMQLLGAEEVSSKR